MDTSGRRVLAEAVAKVTKRMHQVRERGESIDEQDTKATLIEPVLAAKASVNSTPLSLPFPTAHRRSFWQYCDDEVGKLAPVEHILEGTPGPSPVCVEE